MTVFRKKLLLLLVTFFAAACLGFGLLFMPVAPDAAGVSEIKDESDFIIEGGVFKGLSDSAYRKYGRAEFTVRLPATVTAIGDGNKKPAAGESAQLPGANALFGTLTQYLTGVTFEAPQNITAIGYRSFVNCSALADMDLGALTGLLTMDGGAFTGCSSLAAVTLPAGITAVPDYAFMDCSSLTSVAFDGAVSTIGASAFANCGMLFSFPEAAGLSRIGASAFYNCDSFVSFTVPDTVTEIGENAFGSCGNLKTVTLPAGISAIPASLFQGCSSLGDFNIPDSVKEIGREAFANCISFTKLTVPAGITKIEIGAFSGLTGVTEINYYAVDAASIGKNPFALTSYGHANVTVNIGSLSQSAVKTVPKELFAGHRSVKEVIFKNVILADEAAFGERAFKDCISLGRVQFGNNCRIPVINTEAFSGCTALYAVEELENIDLKTIGERAFSGCGSLNSIVIGNNVTAIRKSAFNGCERLLEVKNLSALTITAGSSGPDDCCVASNAKYVYGQDGETRVSENASGYVFYADTASSKPEILLIGYTGSETDMTLPYSYDKDGKHYAYDIYMYAFKDNRTVSHIIIPDESGCTKIGKSAFAGCTSLTGVKFPSGLLELNDNLFESCVSLTHVDFNNNNRLSKIPDNMFLRCTSLASVTIPKKVVTINSYAFGGCTGLRTVEFEADRDKDNNARYNLTAIQGGAFSGCSSLTAIRIPASVNLVGQNCFRGCANLKFVYLPSADGTYAVTYGADVFRDCSEELILICADKAQYDADKEKANIRDAVITDSVRPALTYTVDLVLVYDGGEQIVKKLAGMHGGYTQNGLLWTPSGSMPVQGGYENAQQYMISKWFATPDYKNEIDVNMLTEMLARGDGKAITLYARYFSHPNLTPYQDKTLRYDADMEYTVKDILMEAFRENGVPVSAQRAEELTSTFTFTVESHRFADGTEDISWLWEPGGVIKDAGTYDVSIKLRSDGLYGHWYESARIEFTIERGIVDITGYVVWKTENGSLAPAVEYDGSGNLVTTPLYFYNTQTPHLDDNNGEPSLTANVAASYTVATSDLAVNPVVLILDWADGAHRYGEAVADTYSGNVGTAAGTYTASVTLRPYANYIFDYNRDSELSAELHALGLAFTPMNDGTIVVRKTWYIAISNSNQLLAAGGGQFCIPDELTYMGGGMPARPRLSKIDGQASGLVTFTLSFTDTNGNIINFGSERRIGIDLYESYFNATMPAGEYVATFYIGNGEEADGTPVMGDPEGKTYAFRIKEIPLTRADENDVKGVLTDCAVPYNDGGLKFTPTDRIKLLDRLEPSKPQAVPYKSSPWYDYLNTYYTPFEIRYCVVRGNENPDTGFYTEAEYLAGGADMVKPEAIGTYTVYYRIDAPNYGGEITGSYRLSITQALRPLLPMYEYDGGNVLNSVIRSLDKIGIANSLEYFEIYTMLDYGKLDNDDLLNIQTQSAPMELRNEYFYDGFNDGYSGVGTHHIFLKIKDKYSSYIVWDSTLGFKTDRGYLVLPIEIDASEKALSVTEWEYGRFKESVNAPVWNAQFGDGTMYVYTLRSANTAGGVVYLFSNDDNMNAQAAAEKKTFNDAPVGVYTLTAIAQPEGGTKVEITKTVKVRKVNIYFDKDPYISGWTYGQLTADTASEDVINYTFGADIANDAAAIKGKITLKYSTAVDYERGMSPAQSLSAIAKNGLVPSGDYYVIITRPADDTYEALNYAVKFSVLKTRNYLIEAPVDGQQFAKGTSAKTISETFRAGYGTQDNVTVYFRVAGSGDEFEKAENFPQLEHNQFKTGSYEMYAVIEGENLERLQTGVISFSVTDKLPSGGTDGGVPDTAVIAALISFAVIAAAVAAVGVTLAVIRSKRANAEYIRTVKSEMKRR